MVTRTVAGQARANHGQDSAVLALARPPPGQEAAPRASGVKPMMEAVPFQVIA
ncbi:hypothetical protein [Streptomyces sp. NPDC094049]|uniref:hypothetical protein n=1 Tax=Streptomyces sp. NPDC094049 TaxID=3154987 RepID=UPI00332F39DC